MKSYIKLFMPVMLAVVLGSLTLVFAQSKAELPRTEKRGDGEFGRMPPPGFGGPQAGGPGLNPRVLEQLALTDAQKTEVKKLLDESAAASKTYFDQAHAAQDRLKDLSAPEAFDEAEARKLIATRNSAQAELEIIRMKTEASIYNLLTAEQLVQAETLRSQRPEFPRRGEMRPPAPPSQK